jgi:tRNA (guanine37-N1)-methyltransferase
MRFDILTIFPELFPAHLETSLIGKAREAGVLDVNAHNIRDFATDKHKTVDDTPYGGGAGMVLRIEPIAKALDSIKAQQSMSESQNYRTIVLSARGEQFTQTKAEEFSKLDQLILICGRYEGIDQRVADYLADEELSIGPYVLNGGEVAALVVLEAVTRLIPGVLGNPESLAEESYTSTPYAPYPITSVEYPQYTKPEVYKDWKVPEVLLSGNHAEIEAWRKQKRKTQSET